MVSVVMTLVTMVIFPAEECQVAPTCPCQPHAITNTDI